MSGAASSPDRSPSFGAATVASGAAFVGATVTSGFVPETVAGSVASTEFLALLQPASGNVQVITPAMTMAVILLWFNLICLLIFNLLFGFVS